MAPAKKTASGDVDAPEVVVPKTFEQAATEQEESRLSLIDQMKNLYKTQKRVRVRVRNDGDVPVQINGYTFLIQPNVWVEVPEDVAWHLENAGYI